VVAAVVIAAGMTACSSAKSARAPAKLSPAASPVTAPSPSLTPEAQVEAFVRTYYDAVNTAVSTGDTSKLITLSRPACSCRRLVQAINDVYSKGHSEGAAFVVHSIDVKEVIGGTAAAEVDYDVTKYTVIDRNASRPDTVEPFHSHDLMSMVKQGDTWIVDSIVQMSSGR